MRFMLLLKSDQSTEAGGLPDPKLMAAMGKYNEALVRAGVLLTGDGLQPSSKGFRVRQIGATTRVSDGPFPDPGELIAGFWILQVKSKAEAIEWAKRCPLEPGVSATGDGTGQIEIRQIIEPADLPAFEADGSWRDAPPAAAVSGGKKQRYMMMIKGNPDSESGAMPAPETLRAMGDAMAELARSGMLVASEGLQPTSKGARVSFAKGKRTVTDGPFAEAKELVCGFAIFRVASKAEAIELAKHGLALRGCDGETEARLLFDAEDFSDELLAEVPQVVRDGAGFY